MKKRRQTQEKDLILAMVFLSIELDELAETLFEKSRNHRAAKNFDAAENCLVTRCLVLALAEFAAKQIEGKKLKA